MSSVLDDKSDILLARKIDASLDMGIIRHLEGEMISYFPFSLHDKLLLTLMA